MPEGKVGLSKASDKCGTLSSAWKIMWLAEERRMTKSEMPEEAMPPPKPLHFTRPRPPKAHEALRKSSTDGQIWELGIKKSWGAV